MSEEVHILVVDDRHEDLLAIQSLLQNRDYHLVTAASGAEALKRVLERDYAVILLDVLMPGMDGFEVASIIKQRERSRDTPVIFLTAAGEDMAFIYRGYSVGAVDYLSKPLDADVLKAKIGIFVELYRKDRRIKAQAEALRAADRRERELELAELRLATERRYRNLAEAIPHIVWTANPDGGITYFNQRWMEYTGQTLEQAKASWRNAVHPHDAVRYSQSWEHALAEQRVFELEVRLLGRDGTHRWHLCRAVPEHDDRGRIVGWLGTYTDFDDRKRALDAAEEAVHVRDEFMSIAAHELRTPLMTLQLRMHTLNERVKRLDDEAARIDLTTKSNAALRQCGRLADLIERLLDVARISVGRLSLHKERFDLTDAAREVTDRFTEVAARARCTLALSIEATVAGSWDRLRVEQVLQNFIDNAIKYAGGAPIEVTVGQSGGMATLSVRDHGKGIPPAEVERIFEQFQQSVPARQFGGLGLGLYITRQIALAHGGTVRVDSQPGLGSTFVLELPLGEDQAARLAPVDDGASAITSS